MRHHSVRVLIRQLENLRPIRSLLAKIMQLLVAAVAEEGGGEGLGDAGIDGRGAAVFEASDVDVDEVDRVSGELGEVIRVCVWLGE